MAETKWHGKYKAIVMDNNDPERRGRIRVQCPKVLGNYLSAWCEPCIPYATDFAGDYYVPPVNEAIWVEFEEGDVDKPIWGGGWYKINSSPLTLNSNPTDYRYISFKNSVLRMGEKEFIFELRDSDKSYTVTIDTSTWIGLNYIGRKTEKEILDLERLIVNTDFILEKIPQNITALGDQFTDFVVNTYNKYVTETLEPELKELSETLVSALVEIKELKDKVSDLYSKIDPDLANIKNEVYGYVDGNGYWHAKLRDLIGSLRDTVNFNAEQYNNSIEDIGYKVDGATWWYMGSSDISV